MKAEREVKWASYIHDSKHTKDVNNFKFSPRPASKRDFEKVALAPLNDRDFADWFSGLVEFGAVEFVGKISVSSRNNTTANGYIVHAKKLVTYLKNHENTREVFDKIFKLCNRDRVI